MIAVKVFEKGEFYDFNFRELLFYLEFRLSSRSAMSFYFLCC